LEQGIETGAGIEHDQRRHRTGEQPADPRPAGAPAESLLEASDARFDDEPGEQDGDADHGIRELGPGGQGSAHPRDDDAPAGWPAGEGGRSGDDERDRDRVDVGAEQGGGDDEWVEGPQHVDPAVLRGAEQPTQGGPHPQPGEDDEHLPAEDDEP